MNELPTSTQLWKLNKVFAQRNGLPVVFAGRTLGETAKAVYIYGHGSVEAQTRFSACCVCGMGLSHPGSILLGIGPYCLGNLGLRDEMIRGKSQAEIDLIIGKKILERKVDCWIPKTCIKAYEPASVEIEIPADHPRKRDTIRAVTRRCSQVKFQDTGLPGIKIEFPFDPDILAKVKALSGRRYHAEATGKFWTCPLSLDSLMKLKAWGFTLSDKLEEFLAESTLHVDDVAGIVVPGLKKPLYEFQGKGVAFLNARNGRALIADEMGLGKTVQALAYLQLHRELRPAVVVVPASVKLQWAAMAEGWMPDPNVQVLSGEASNIPIIGDIIVVNYDILADQTRTLKDKSEVLVRKGWWERLESIRPKVLVLDEIHYVKNSQAARTKAIKKLAKGVQHVIGLSGTPIVNRPIEAYNALQMIDPTVVPGFWTYAQRYCGAVHNGYGWDFSGASNTEELHHLLVNSIMIRRKKSEVLGDLPPKIRSFVPMELDNQDEYRHVESDFIRWVQTRKGAEAAVRASSAEQLAKIEALKQVCVAGKMASALEWIREFVEIKKLVVFCTHQATVDRLMNEFGDRAVKIDGSVHPDKRLAICNRFQTDDAVRLFVGNIKAAGVGITLTASDSAAFLELPWVPSDLTQAEDRVHRITQSKQVTIYYLLAYRSIEERIMRLLDAKQSIVDSILDGKSLEEISIFRELMEEYEKAS